MSNGTTRVQVRPLYQNKKFTLHPIDVQLIHPDPSDTPSSQSCVDRSAMTHCLTEDDMKQLWNPRSDDSVPPEDRVTLHWHHRLRYAPLVSLKRLAKRGVLPQCILKVQRMPLCASCAFAKAHRKSWRHKGGGHQHIKKEEHNKPGMATSCDHIVSRQPGLVPQSSGTLTHDRFWGSVLYVDHHSNFMYNHMITGTTSQ